MSNIKVNLIIDGNALLYKDVFNLKKINTVKQDLEILLEKDTEKILSSYSYDNVFFVSDKGSSWRKDLYPEYKGHREKDGSLDWDQIYEDYDKHKLKLKENPRINMIEVNTLEGDDIIAHITRETNKKGYSNIIVASDSDLHQLLEYDIEKGYINFLWNYKFSDERLYMPENYKIFLNSLEKEVNEGFDLFGGMNFNHDFLGTLETMINRTKVKEFNSEESFFKKIVHGDRKDNIKTLIKVKNKKLDESGQGIGESGALKCYNLYKETYGNGFIDFEDEETINNIADVVLYYKKLKENEDVDDLKQHIIKNIKFNHKILLLDTKNLPKNLKKELNNEFKNVTLK